MHYARQGKLLANIEIGALRSFVASAVDQITAAWHGMAWHGMAWHGMAWHGMAWHGMAACGYT
jgi:hypothetical protein